MKSTASTATGSLAQPATQDWVLPLVAIMAFAFILYANTLRHGYALDDSIVITENIYTQQGLQGIGKIFTTDAFEGFFKEKKDLVEGGRYRPLSIATFAVEHSFSKKNPGISHFFNVVLYGFLGTLVFAFLRLIMPEDPARKWWLQLPFLITMLFMAHPIHTEVVANIKGRDELMALLFLMLSMVAALLWIDNKNWLWVGVTGISFFLALLSKETPLPFVILLPITLLFFRPPVKLSPYVIISSAVLVATAVYMVLRLKYVGFSIGAESAASKELLNDPFAIAKPGQRIATVLLTWAMYLGKLVLPLKLSHDYYFNQIPLADLSDWRVIGSVLLNLALVGLGIFMVLRRHVVGYGILFFYLSFSITSNLILSIGTTMGERFVFVPSLGFLIALVAGLDALFQKSKSPKPYALLILVGLVTIAFTLKTVTRNAVWKDNFTLFTTDAETSPNSAKVRTAAGGVMVEKAEEPKTLPDERQKLLRGAVGHLEAAIKIYPEHGNAWLLLGNARHKLEDYAGSLAAYDQCIYHRPVLWDAYKNAAITARKFKRFDLAAGYYRREIAGRQANYKGADPKKAVSADLWFDWGNNYEEWGIHPDSAIWAYSQAAALDPKMAKAYGQIGRVYGMQLNNLDAAIQYGEQALQIDPKLDWVYENVGIATAMKGDAAAALKIFERGLAANPNSAKLYKNIGITYQNMGDAAKAQENFARAQQLDPTMR